MDLLRKNGKRNSSNRSNNKDAEPTSSSSNNDNIRKETPEKAERRQEQSGRSSSKKNLEEAAFPAVKDDREIYNPSTTTESAEQGEEEEMGGGEKQSNKPVYRNDTTTTGKGDGSKGPWFTQRQVHLFKKPPPAEQAAYAGPPRYDWVDIETSAAIKLQAAFRRKHVMDVLADEGHTTAAVRNHARRRKAAQEATNNPAQDFVNLFNCCGVDLGLGGGNNEKYWDITRELEKARYEETHKEKQQKEEMLRRKYQRKPPKDTLVENVEVVQ